MIDGSILPVFDVDGLHLQTASTGIVGIDYPSVVAAEVASLLHREGGGLKFSTTNGITDGSCQLLVTLAQIDGTANGYLWGLFTGSLLIRSSYFWASWL